MILGKISNLKKISISNAREIFLWRTSKTVKKNFPSIISKSFLKHKRWLTNVIQSKKSNYFIITTKKNKNIGLCFLNNIDLQNKKAEFGYYLSDSSYYGKGFAIEAEYLIIEYGFNSLKLNKIYCEILEFNAKVIEIHKKYGFKIDGVKREDIFKEGKYHNLVLMSLLKRDSKKYLRKINRLINLLKR